MSHDLHNISFQLGEIRGHLASIDKNTSDIKKEVKGVGDRVTVIEKQKEFEKGVDSQNKKISGVIGSIFGAIFGALTALLVK